MKKKLKPLASMSTLPAHLRRANSPHFCTCRSCRPEMTAEQREYAEAVMAEWDAARAAWRRANDVGALEMMRYERPRPPPSKKTRRR